MKVWHTHIKEVKHFLFLQLCSYNRKCISKQTTLNPVKFKTSIIQHESLIYKQNFSTTDQQNFSITDFQGIDGEQLILNSLEWSLDKRYAIFFDGGPNWTLRIATGQSSPLKSK